MKQQLFTVLDGAAQMHLEPFFCRTPDEAIRGFGAACKNPEHMFGKFPEDYTLYLIGEFDAETAELIPCRPTKIAMAMSYVVHGDQRELRIAEEADSA